MSPSRVVTPNLQDQYRKEYIVFRCTLIQRIRDIPNDRFGKIYLDPIEMHTIHHTIKNIIQSLEMLTALQESVTEEYSVTKYFNHNITILDPIHLYPSDFLTASPNNDSKIAGYKTYSEFTSPNFWPRLNPLACR